MLQELTQLLLSKIGGTIEDIEQGALDRFYWDHYDLLTDEDKKKYKPVMLYEVYKEYEEKALGQDEL